MSDFGGRFRLRDRVPGRPWYQVIWWDLCSTICFIWMKVFYRYEFIGEDRVPRRGPVLFISNHQSYYDPVLNGLVVNRRQFTALADAALFKFKPAGWVIRSIGALPLSAGAGDKGALKAALKEMEEGRCILIYPEGTRTSDGQIVEFKRGTTLLLRRSKATVLPMAIEGAFDVWPRHRLLPRFRGRIMLIVGSPRSAEEICKEGAEEGVAALRQEIDRMRLEARALLRERTRGRWPKEGPGDEPSPS